MDEERWLPVPGYAGFYEVSDLGSVFSLARAATAGGPVAVQLNSKGYHVVTLSKYGRRRTVPVGRMVLLAFRGPANGRRARHGAKGKADDSLANLEWRLCQGQSWSSSWTTGTASRGSGAAGRS